MSLITHQQLCIDRMLEPRTSEKRALKNRVAALRKYRTHAACVGYNEAEIEQQVRDIKDMYQLELNASDELGAANSKPKAPVTSLKLFGYN